MATYLEQSLTKLKHFEGSVPWMYRDTVGKVTVGVGLMLPNVEAALALPFTLSGRAATAAEIRADFARVTAMVEGKTAAYYRIPESPQLGEETIDTKLLNVLRQFETRLQTALHGYDQFPDAVKLALLDMAYNLGPAALLSGYPHLIAAVEQGNWVRAAAECTRQGPSAERNTWTRGQFLAAVVTTIKAEAESWWARLVRRLRDLWR
ncbi:hypothetical protein [Granulicella sp. dw_53]|uniref:glycoside hydrolase family protein n=1 Tax=Granulicella sp. dw_53 TaxID=2719792 RepID=UPI001BD4C38D|nr:hypothetical protein [Granulicella sp. dw_53]